jgi:hypothetical protein
VPQGQTVGIPGAPQTLPAVSGLLPGNWAVCLNPGQPGGGTIRDLSPAGRGAVPADNQRILVTSPAGRSYVVWDNTKYPLTTGSALVALGLGNQDPVTASAAWLAELRTGPALAPAAVPGAGLRGPSAAGHARTVIGELFESTAAGVNQYYVLLKSGLAPISHTEFALFAALPGERPAVRASPAGIASSAESPDRIPTGPTLGVAAAGRAVTGGAS